MNRFQRFPFAPGTITRTRRRVPRWHRLLLVLVAAGVGLLWLLGSAWLWGVRL